MLRVRQVAYRTLAAEFELGARHGVVEISTLLLESPVLASRASSLIYSMCRATIARQCSYSSCHGFVETPRPYNGRCLSRLTISLQVLRQCQGLQQ